MALIMSYNDVKCKYSDGVKWYKIEISVDGKSYPCCHYLELSKEFEQENLGSTAEDFEQTILPNYRKLCYRKCNNSK